MRTRRETMALEHAERVRGGGRWKRALCGWCALRGYTPDRRGVWCLNTNTGYYHCWRCAVRGYLPGFSPPDSSSSAEADAPPPGIPIPRGFYPLTAPKKNLHPARRYVLARGISRAAAVEARIGACLAGDLKGRVVVPIFGEDDATWVGWSARLYREPEWEREPKYRYPEGMPRARILYNQAALHAPSERPVMCVEGVFDALPYYPDVVAFLGKPSPEQVLLLLETERPLCIALDGDAWHEGYCLSEKLKLRGKLDVVSARLPPTTDPATVPPGWLWSEAEKLFTEHAIDFPPHAEATGH